MSNPIKRVEQILSDLVASRPVVLVGDHMDTHLVVAADRATTRSLAFLIRHGSGFVCAAVTQRACDRLSLPPMVGAASDDDGDHCTVAVDAIEGVGTGISAADRAKTLRLLADPRSVTTDFARPGHVVPVRARTLGVLTRPGPAEATVDLLSAAGLHRVGAYAALVSQTDSIRMADAPEGSRFAEAHQLNWVSVEDVVLYRRITELHVRRTFTELRGTPYGDFKATGFHSEVSGTEYIAYRVAPSRSATPVIYLRRESDFAPHVSSIEPGLQPAFADIAAHGDGIVLVERRLNDVGARLRTHHLDDRSADIAQILRELGVTRCVVSPRTPHTVGMLRIFGIDASAVPHDAIYATPCRAR